jgi:hypothetical protein
MNGHPVGTGPTVVEDGDEELVEVELAEGGIELFVYEKIDEELIEGLLDMLEMDIVEEVTVLEVVGSILLVELTKTVVVVAPDAISVTVSVTASRPMTPSFRV